jgi:hypothetical protein
MAGALEVSGDIAAAATALSGLLLVFLGSIAASYDSFDAESKPFVRARYKGRAIRAAVGFFATLVAVVTAIIGKWLANECLVVLSVVALFVSLAVITRAVILIVKDID